MGPVGASSYQGGPPPAPGQGAPGGASSLPRMIFSLTKAVETLIQAVPQAAEEGDKISQLLQQIMVKASGSSNGAQGSQSPQGGGAF